MELDPRVVATYETGIEADRLSLAGRGELTRLRTWDIFDRFIPSGSTIVDIGGGPGIHAEHLADRGHRVTLIDPVPLHVEQATQRSSGRFGVRTGDARALDLPGKSFDVALLMGPLYHLIDADDRHRALVEAKRVLRPGGRLLAEIIPRRTWLLDATARNLLDDENVWSVFEENMQSGLSTKPELHDVGTFWAYFHHVEELADELRRVGFESTQLVAVEGFAWLLDDLETRMQKPEHLLRAIRLCEADRSLLGVSTHVIGIADTPS